MACPSSRDSMIVVLSDETIPHLCDFLRDLADAIENQYCARLINRDHRSYERQPIAEGRAGEHALEHLGDNQLPF